MTQLKLPDLSLILFLIGINVVLLFNIQIGLKFYSGAVLLKYIGHYILFLSLLVSIIEGKLNYLKPAYQKWFLFFAAVSILIIIIGLINKNFFISTYFASSDILVFSYLSGLFVASKKENWNIIEITLWIHLIAISTLCTISLIEFEGPLLIEKVIFSPVYYWWTLIYGWIYFLVTLDKRGFIGKIVIIPILTGFFILDLFFLKRNPLAALALCAGISFLAYKPKYLFLTFFKKIMFLKYWVLGILVMIIILGGIRISGIATFGERYQGYGLSQFMRKLSGHGGFIRTAMTGTRLRDEPQKVLNNIGIFEFLFGRGAGATIPVDINHSPSGYSGDLHSGLAKIILKGGIIFLLAWISMFFMILKDFIKNEKYELIPFYTIVTVKFLMLPVYTFFAWSLEFGLFMLCAGRCMSKSRYLISSSYTT